MARSPAAAERLAEDEAGAAMGRRSMDGQATPAQIGGSSLALAMRGETVDEIAGVAAAMRARADAAWPRATPSTPAAPAATARGMFNISTAAALVVAGAGVRVAKHGNRSASARAAAAPTCSRRSG